MKHINEILKNAKEGMDVSIRGWIYRHRKLGEKKVFMVIRDSTGYIQAIVSKEHVDDKTWDKAVDLYIESSIIVKGTLKKDERAPGGWEVHVNSLTVVSKGFPFPIQKDLSEEFLLDVRHLWLRSKKMVAIMKARHHIINYLREWLNKNDFYEISPPMLTVAGAEGGADMFEVPYFGRTVYLTQSSQLYGEAAIFGLERVYTLAPSFRAEKSRTRRHLTEFWHLEPEAAWVRHEENMRIQEEMVSFVVESMVKNHSDILETLGRDIDELKKVKPPFPRLKYTEAVDKVNELGGEMEYGEDFGADEEALLTSIFDVPIFITNFPLEIKAFYMAEDENNPGTALNDDMLAPKGHGEIIGGSERIWEYDVLIERMKKAGLNPDNYGWYLDLRKYGSVPHSGFGLGIERFVKWILNLETVRDAIPFPRNITRYYP